MFQFTNVSKTVFQHIALATFLARSSHTWLEATVLCTADLGVAEDLRMGVLHRKGKNNRKALKIEPWITPTEVMGNQLTTEMKRNLQRSTETGKNSNQTKEIFMEKRLLNSVMYKKSS